MQLKFMEFLDNCKEIEVCVAENTKVNEYFKFLNLLISNSVFSADVIRYLKL